MVPYDTIWYRLLDHANPHRLRLRPLSLSPRFISLAALDFHYPASHDASTRLIRGLIGCDPVSPRRALGMRDLIHGHIRGDTHVEAGGGGGVMSGHKHRVLYAHVLLVLPLLYRSCGSSLLLLSLELTRGPLLLLLLSYHGGVLGVIVGSIIKIRWEWQCKYFATKEALRRKHFSG